MSDRPKRPPIGGGASRNRTNHFSNDANVDARSPNETGMLPFVPGGELSQEDSGSATEFFEISPSKNRNDAQEDSRNQFQQPPPQNQVYNSNVYNQNHHHQGYQQRQFAPDNRIGAGELDRSSNHQSPYIPPPTQGDPETGGSSTSYRVYAILITMFGVVLIAAVIAIYLISTSSDDKDATERSSTTTLTGRSSNSNDISEEDADNSSLESTTDVGRSTGGRNTGGRKGGSKGQGGKKGQTTTATGGKLAVSVIGGTVVAVDLVCGGAKTRSKKSGASFIFSGVTSKTCSLQFKPSGVTWKGTISPGQLNCKLIGGSQQVDCN